GNSEAQNLMWSSYEEKPEVQSLRVSLFILTALCLSTSLQAERLEIIVKKQDRARTMLSGNSQEARFAGEQFEVLKFESREDLERAKQELSNQGVSWEPNYIFKADVISTGDVLSKS